MENSHRLFDFQGSDTEYIKFLESKLMSVGCQLCFQQSTLSSSSARCENNATALCLSPTSSTHPARTSGNEDALFRRSNPIPYSLPPRKRTSSGHIRSPGDNDGPLSPSQSSTASSCRGNETHSNHPTSTRSNEAAQCLQSLSSNPTSDVQNNSTAQACEIVYYNSTLGCPPKKRQKLPDAVPKWKTDANKLLASVPTTDKWNERKKETGFNDVANNRVAIRILLGAPSKGTLIVEKDGAKGDPPELPRLNPMDHKTMISNACRYGRLSTETGLNAAFSSLVFKYQKLIFINYCIVLLSTGNSIETIDWMMRRYISDSSSRNLQRYRRGCMFVNQCISRLLQRGWGYKSWEIFVICAQSPHLYARLADAPVECHKMFERLGAAKVPQCEDGFIPFCIPSIIKYLIGDEIEISQICASLGYNFGLIANIHDTFISQWERHFTANDSSNAENGIEYTNFIPPTLPFGQTISDARTSPNRHINNMSDTDVALQNDNDNIPHSGEARNPGRRDNGSYDANIERPMPSGYPQSTSQGKSTANEPLYSGGRPGVNTEEPNPSSNGGTGIPSQENENQPLTLLQPLPVPQFQKRIEDSYSLPSPQQQQQQQQSLSVPQFQIIDTGLHSQRIEDSYSFPSPQQQQQQQQSLSVPQFQIIDTGLHSQRIEDSYSFPLPQQQQQPQQSPSVPQFQIIDTGLHSQRIEDSYIFAQQRMAPPPPTGLHSQEIDGPMTSIMDFNETQRQAINTSLHSRQQEYQMPLQNNVNCFQQPLQTSASFLR